MLGILGTIRGAGIACTHPDSMTIEESEHSSPEEGGLFNTGQHVSPACQLGFPGYGSIKAAQSRSRKSLDLGKDPTGADPCEEAE